MTYSRASYPVPLAWPIVLLLVAIAAFVAPLQFGIEIEDGGGALFVLGCMAAVSALVTFRAGLLSKRARARILADDAILARWSCSDDDWRQLNPTFTRSRRKNDAESRDIIISRFGLVAGRDFHDWSCYGNKLIDIGVSSEVPPRLHIRYKRRYRRSSEEVDLVVPLSSTRVAEARRIVETFHAGRKAVETRWDEGTEAGPLSPDEYARYRDDSAIWKSGAVAGPASLRARVGCAIVALALAAAALFAGYRVVSYFTDPSDVLWSIDATDDGVGELVFSPDGALLAFCGPFSPQTKDNAVRLIRTKDGSPVHQFDDQGSSVSAIAFSPDGSRIALAHVDRVAVFDSRTGRSVSACVIEEFTCIRTLRFSPDGMRIAGNGDDLYVWDVATGAIAHRAGMRGEWRVVDAAFTSSGHIVVAENEGDSVRMRDLDARTILLSATMNGSMAAYPMALAPDGSVLAVQERDGVRVWKPGSRDESGRLPSPYADAVQLIFSRDGARLLCASTPGSLVVWDVAKGAPLYEQASAEDIWVQLSPDGHWCAIGGSGAGVSVNNVTGPAETRTFSHRDKALELFPSSPLLRFSPDGRFYVSAHRTIQYRALSR